MSHIFEFHATLRRQNISIVKKIHKQRKRKTVKFFRFSFGKQQRENFKALFIYWSLDLSQKIKLLWCVYKMYSVWLPSDFKKTHKTPKSIYSNYDEQEFGTHKLSMEAKQRNWKLKELAPLMELLSLVSSLRLGFKIIATSQTPIPHGQVWSDHCHVNACHCLSNSIYLRTYLSSPHIIFISNQFLNLTVLLVKPAK